MANFCKSQRVTLTVSIPGPNRELLQVYQGHNRMSSICLLKSAEEISVSPSARLIVWPELDFADGHLEGCKQEVHGSLLQLHAGISETDTENSTHGS